MSRYFIETRADGFPWTKEGCNERKNGKWVPHQGGPAALVYVRRLKNHDDPLWARAEYRVIPASRGWTPRDMVVLAAIGDTSASEWLMTDSRGAFEKDAAKLWESTAEVRKDPKVKAADVALEVANVLALTALKAMIAYEKSKGRKSSKVGKDAT